MPTWPQAGVDVVARLHQARKIDSRKARRLAKNDALLVWRKGQRQTDLFTRRQWRRLPDQLTVRIVRFSATIRGHRARRITWVTSLLDPKLSPAQQLIGLYARRWRLELCLRDLKTTMGMEQLRCQSIACPRIRKLPSAFPVVLAPEPPALSASTSACQPIGCCGPAKR